MIDKVYVTKYALTGRVRLCKVIDLDLDSDDWVRVDWPGGWNDTADFRLGKDAYVTRADAENAFEKMRASAIKSAEKKLERLRAMKFEVKE